MAPIKCKAAYKTAHSETPRAMNCIAGQPNFSTIAVEYIKSITFYVLRSWRIERSKSECPSVAINHGNSSHR